MAEPAGNGSGAPPGPAEGEGEAVVAALAAAPGTTLHETHGSWVVVGEELVHKVKKPVRWDFLDYTTLAERREACRAEVAVNSELAPGIYLGVKAAVRRSGSVELTDEDAAGAIEYVVEMRRFDERRTAEALLAAGGLTDSMIDAVAERIARFHDAAAIERRPDPVAALVARVDADLDEARRSGGELRAGWSTFAASIEARFGAEVEQRSRAGLVRDGHGDLRAEHVVLERPPVIVDRLEFDPALRTTDVADDLAFLAMDFERLGDRRAADRLIDAYERAGGRPASRALAAAFAWRRATVRFKVAEIRGDEGAARAFADVADATAWRARSPETLVVCGPPASGKSTIAGMLAERLELEVVSSDRVRKELLGIAETERAGEAGYDPGVTARVYEELASRAARAVERGGGVIVDATYRTAASRRELLGALGERALWLWCEASEAMSRERARRRELEDPGRISDAGPEVAARLAREFEPLDELPPARVCRLPAELDAERRCDVAAEWLDRYRASALS